MMTVREVLDAKGRGVLSVDPGCTVFDALTMMAEQNVGAVLVVDGARTLGIFTERDYARQVVLKGRTSRETLVRDVMTARVVYVVPTHTVDECMALMTDMRCRHLPVLEAGRLAGIVSIGDIVKSVIADREYTIDRLVQYITSG